MEQKKNINFGFRGWILMLWAATAAFGYVVAGNYPLNIMADLYGGAQTLSLIFTGASIVGIIVQVIFSRKVKHWKRLSVGLGIATIVFLILIMVLSPGIPWMICYGLGTAISALYGTWATAVLLGVWFPKRKGTVMGIVTWAYPIGNALLGAFASKFFGLAFDGNHTTQGAALESLWPYVLVVVIGFIIGVILISEFPEQVGAFRDNDKSMTPEVAMAMMKAEEENRKTTVWTTAHTVASPDFWLITIPLGFLLMFAVGAMTQTNAMISPYADQGVIAAVGGYSGVMMFIAGAGIVGSYVFGLIDTKLGTKKAVLFSHVLMLISGILGMLNNGTTLFIGFIILGLFMGASSNYTVSTAVQYWRIEDFPSVFSVVNPVANLLNSCGPTVVAALLGSTLGVSGVFMGAGIAAIISIILCALFKPARVKVYDDKYRLAAGKPLDDVLVGRK